MTAAGGAVVDQYAVVGEKLAFLLDIKAGDAVLFVGPRSASWREDGARYFARCDWVLNTRDLAAIDGPYGLVVWDPSVERGSRLTSAASILYRASGTRGRVLLLGRNSWPPAVLRRTPGSAVSEARWSLRAYRRALTDAGFRGVRSFLAMPNMAAWEEAVATAGERSELPPGTHWALRAARLLRLHDWLHDGFILTAGRDGCPLAGLEARLSEALSPAVTGAGLRLTRFGLRTRGALVLTLRDRVSRAGVIVRVAVTSEVDRLIAINAKRLEELLARPRLSHRLRACLPRPLVSTILGDQRVYAERRIEGHLAWQLARGSSARAQTDADAVQFINDLARGTLLTVDTEETALGDLLERSAASDFGGTTPAPVRELALEITRALGTQLAGRRVPLVLGHGDFGYGNLIVGRDGRLRGVIDWDCSRPRELWGVDWCNFLIQRWRTDTGTRLSEAVRAVSPQLDLATSPLWTEGFTTDERSELVQIAFQLSCLRYVTRAARYPAEFLTDADDYLDVLTWLGDQPTS